MYNAFNKEKAKLCPGGSCETHKKEKIQKIDPRQIIVVLVFFVIIFFIVSSGIIKPGKDLRNSDNTAETTNENTSDCKVPDWAIKIGHEEQYKEHHGCN